MPLPNFFIAGAPKSGSTSLWAYLRQHPDVFMTTPKEPVFFSNMQGLYSDQARLGKSELGSKPFGIGKFSEGWDWYLSHYANCKNEQAIGEASVLYFYSGDSAELISKFIPSARLIFILRDPVDRLYSDYWFERSLYDLKTDVLPEFDDLVSKNHPRLGLYIRKSSYKKNIESFYSHFPKEQILILLTDDLKANPEKTMRETCNFLGIDDSFQFDLNRKHNESVNLKNAWLMKFIHTVSYYMKPSRFLPNSLRVKLTHLARKMYFSGSEKLHYPKMSPEIRARLVPLFEEDICFVERELGRNLDPWRKI